MSESTILGFLLVFIMFCLCGYFVYSGIKCGGVQLHRYIAMLLLFVANACFWALFEQAGSSLNFFAREFSTPMFGSMPRPGRPVVLAYSSRSTRCTS